jgi:fermentation-respiration switch protein FrsA (DUF1100 family)
MLRVMTFETSTIFHSGGVPLAGRFIRNADDTSRQPAIVVMGSWLTVKEQMPTTYARRLAGAGYTAFVFDFAGFGGSEGAPRQTEMPSRKIADIAAAVAYLQTVSFVDAQRIGALAVCASAQYTMQALANGTPIRSFASVAGWYHDPAAIAPFYGGEPGVRLRLTRAHEATERYLRTRELTIVPAYRDGDDRAGMFFRLDYYGQAERGAVPEWKNEMSEMTWLHWLTYDGLSHADRVTTPTLFVHSDGCVFPDRVKDLYARVQGPKELVWGEGTQIDFYDQPAQVDLAIASATRWFATTLRA